MYNYYNMYYPLSKNNNKCIGPCYEKNVSIIHPSEFVHVTNKKYAFCPIDAKKNNDDKKIIDECLNPTHNKDIKNYANIEYNKLTNRQFLLIHYDIENYVEFLNYVESNDLPLNTHLRLIDIAINVFFYNINFILPHIQTIIKKTYEKRRMNTIIKSISSNFSLDENNNIIFISSENKLNNVDIFLNKLREYILKDVLTDIFLETFLFNFFKKYEKNFNDNEKNNDKNIEKTGITNMIIKELDVAIKENIFFSHISK